MRYTKLFTKTLKSSKKYDSANATFLIRGGFIDQTMAGVYTFLPLGLRVLRKIEAIVRQEMDKIAVECVMPALAPKSAWEDTGRIDSVDVLMKTSGANEASKQKNTSEYILNSTHEEIITPIAKTFNRSYKDLPAAIYQVQSKFRNEARAKSGILRGREFRMKDLYSFHASEEDLLDYYHNQVKPAYVRVFERVGLGADTVIALASGGDFTKEFSHEFQTRCESGEDTIYHAKSADIFYNSEVAPSMAPDHVWSEDGKALPLEAVYGENITGMDALTSFLKIPQEQCVKTLIYETDDGQHIAAAVRGDYDVNTLKLAKIARVKSVTLASNEVVHEVTSAQVGYAGLKDLPESVDVYVDDTLEHAINFEMGANKTHYHFINCNWDRDLPKPAEFFDIKQAKAGDRYPETGEVYDMFSASEVGNIFPLNTKFSKSIGYSYTGEDGKEHDVYMGSYGIGTSRLMGVIVEKFHDENGILWPIQLAPFTAHLISLKGAEDTGKEIYRALTEAGIEVLWDDRNESPGAKFADADLIGCPVRLVVSAKTGEQVEWKLRAEKETELLSLEAIIEKLQQIEAR